MKFTNEVLPFTSLRFHPQIQFAKKRNPKTERGRPEHIQIQDHED
jgi:hypothetical protein